MKIVLCVFIVGIFVAYLLTVLRRAAEPDFAAKGILSGEKLGYKLTALAFSSKKVRSGNGMSLRFVRKRLIAARKFIGELESKGVPLEDCERNFFNAYFRIDEALGKLTQSKKAFRSLPHINGVPRLYSFCELLVKSTGGLLGKESVRSAVNTYSAETPLGFREIAELENMLRFAVCEYLAIYAAKITAMRSREKSGNYLSVTAEYNARVCSAVNSLHTLGSFMTDKFVNSLSPVYRVLNEGNDSFYMLSESTKRMYLYEIARVAKRRNMAEKTVAAEILFRSEKDGKDISHYILAPKKSRGVQRAYAIGFCVAVVGLAVASAFIVPRLGWLYALLALPIFAFDADFLLRRTAGRAVKRRYLPSYDVKYLDKAKHRTAILFPCFAATEEDIADAFSHLSTVAAANPQDIFSYALLFDYPRSSAETAESDEALDKKIREEFARRKELHGRLCALVRKRKRVSGEEYFQGYEKKRGAVLDFNKFMLSGEGEFSLKLGDTHLSEYVITLDSDTLTCDCAELVAMKAHPYCADSAILSVNCKPNGKRSLYAKLFAGETGPGRYRQSNADISHDLFGLGNYTGKGIYDVKKFQAGLENFFPDNRILSHDYIEGAVAGCMNSSLNASEDFPQTFEAGFTRDLRWLRGDWQLLPYTRGKIKNKEGVKRKSSIAPAAAFAIALNLVLSLVPVAQLFVLGAALAAYPYPSVLVIAFAPQILRSVFALAAAYGNPRAALAEIARCLFDIALLPTLAIYKLCAVAVTLYRLAVGRKLLEWSVFAHAKGKISIIPNLVAFAVFAIIPAIFAPNVFFFSLAAVFAAGAALPKLVSRESGIKDKSDVLLSQLHETAKRTFEYFAAQENMYPLPCDCYQADNAKGWCARTSPTNIGMSLVAYAAAYEIGIIDMGRLTAYAEKIVSAVERCEKYEGHLYNWYDCETLCVLPRRFVSSVDSGNFTVALSLMLTYFEGKLKERIQKLIDETNFAALYDDERKLLYIGYDEELKSCTENHYDLLGSESTLTYLFACGYGKIPADTFYNLDRNGVRGENAVTVFSWTGGMFEYLMSRLFINPENGTLYGEAMRGAVKAQINYAQKLKSEVWGISESRYAQFDECGGNLYRAFGVPNIAHSHLPSVQPFAPYAAFLALPYCSEVDFVSNLNAFIALGALGEMGYCDAVDCEAPVLSYMTHHQGMILAACANAVKGDVLCERLQTLPQWRAAKLLCGEEPLRKARRKKNFAASEAREQIEDCGIYLCKTAGAYVSAAKDGVTFGYADKVLLRDFNVCANGGDGRETLLCGDFYAREKAAWHTEKENYICDTELMLLPCPLSVAVTVKYRNIADKRQNVRFTAFADAVLARKEDFEAHPAYSKMFIDTGLGGNREYVWARRKKDGDTVLCFINADSEIDYCANKCIVEGRGRGEKFGQNLNPVLSGEFTAAVEVGKVYSFTCIFAVAHTVEQADYAARLGLSPNSVEKFAGASVRLARDISDNARKIAAGLNARRYPALKAGGVSTDKPAVTYEVSSSSSPEIGLFLADVKLLYETGFSFDTVLFCRYRRNEYPTEFFDAEHEVEKSGVRSACGRNRVIVYKCANEEERNVLKKHCASGKTLERVMWQGGKFVRYRELSESKLNRKSDLPQPEFASDIVRPLGLGGFTERFHYAADLSEKDTPAPWCNIISDGDMGTVITESGGGFSFGCNSRQSKLTKWCNDPVKDEVSELIAITCGNESVSVTKKPLENAARYGVVHAFGYSVFTCEYGGVTAKLTEFVSRDETRKIYDLQIRNNTGEAMDIGAVFAVRPVLGDFAYNTFSSLEYTPYDNGLEIFNSGNGERAYLQCDCQTAAVGADVINKELVLYGEVSASACYAGVTAAVKLGAGESKTVKFSLSPEKCADMRDSQKEFEKVELFYDRLAKVTFDGEFGYLTKWLPYQVYNARMKARAGFYQVSGAYGFRDQLQDCLALLYCDPSLVREHILECARHQFKEGDVQHWWHPPAIGVRTHMCDDRLWLVYTVCEYVAHTGDKAVLGEYEPFLCDIAISPSDVSVYAPAEFSDEKATVLEHCLRALYVSMDFGENGLVRMRGGDWNDAMDKVGELGFGTSVWCSMFLYHVTERFLPLVKDIEICDKLRSVNKSLYEAICSAYENDRFLRAFRDDGTPLGSESSSACKIDILTQSWSVIAGVGSARQRADALETAYSVLCDKEHKIIKLFSPPFESSEGVGYIGDYPLCVRENGGQYTQASVWYVWALFASGQIKRANELLRWLSPADRCATYEDVQKYCVEPYVSAADVYGGENAGKGGWTWYTGSASWLYKCLIEQYAGIKMRGDVVSFDPKLPKDTAELNVTFLFGGERIKVKIVNSSLGGEWRVRIGEVIYNTASLKLTKGLSGKNIAVIQLIK